MFDAIVHVTMYTTIQKHCVTRLTLRDSKIGCFIYCLTGEYVIGMNVGGYYNSTVLGAETFLEHFGEHLSVMTYPAPLVSKHPESVLDF